MTAVPVMVVLLSCLLLFISNQCNETSEEYNEIDIGSDDDWFPMIFYGAICWRLQKTVSELKKNVIWISISQNERFSVVPNYPKKPGKWILKVDFGSTNGTYRKWSKFV